MQVQSVHHSVVHTVPWKQLVLYHLQLSSHHYVTAYMMHCYSSSCYNIGQNWKVAHSGNPLQASLTSFRPVQYLKREQCTQCVTEERQSAKRLAHN